MSFSNLTVFWAAPAGAFFGPRRRALFLGRAGGRFFWAAPAGGFLGGRPARVF